MRKDFLMAIRKSLARFISIFFIVALGVAFFSGIQASAPDMRYSGDAYFDARKLMDLRVISTMGLTEDDVDAIREVSGVSLAEPAYFADVLCGENELRSVLHVESLTDTLNQPDVTKGRLPDKAGECFLDIDYMEDFGYQIGDELTWREDGDGLLAEKNYEIVGAGASPLYISFSRGNTTLGSGEVDGFAYVTEDSFDSDVYTQIYVEAEGARDKTSYTDGYNDLVAEIQDRVEGIQDERCALRKDEVLSDAEEEIADAERELADGKREAEEKLSDAEQELADAEKELKDGRREYEDGRQELSDAREELADGKRQLADGKKEYEDGKAQFEDGVRELRAKQEELNAGRDELNDGIDKLSAARQELENNQQQLEAGQEELDARRAEAEDQIQAGRDQLAAAQSQLDGQRAELDAQINAALAGVTDPVMQEAIRAQFAPYEQQIAEGQAELDAQREQLEAKETQGLEELEKAQAELDSNRGRIEEGWREIESQTAAIEASQQQIEDGQTQINSAWSEIIANQARLNDAAKEIQDNEQKLADAEREIAENEDKLADAGKELEDGERELADGRKEYEDAKADAEEEIADGERKLADAKQELEDLKDPEWTVSTRDDLPEYSGYGDNADRVRNIGRVFPVLFFLVAALISLTTMTRMVEEERTQIGTLKALGYGKLAIASKYLLYAFFATVGGSVFGILVGEKMIPYVVVTAYKIMCIHMPDVVIPYEYRYSLLASGVALLCTMAATISSCYKELLETPASLMRPPAPKAGKRVLLEHIPFLWKRLNFTWKSTVRNLLRYKKRFLMTIFGISGCMALLIVGYGLRDSIMDVAILQYDEIQTYDGIVVADEDASGREKKKLREAMDETEGIERYANLCFKKMDMKKDGESREVYLYVPERVEGFDEFVNLRDRVTGEVYPLTDDGIVVSEKTCQLLDAKVGDTVILQESGKKGREVKISAVCENYMRHYVYMTPKLYAECFGREPGYNDILFTVDEAHKDSPEKVGEQILENEAALSITYTSSIAAQLEDMLDALDSVIIVLIISAGMLAFVVLYNLNNISITERRRELATLKVLGFYDGEVSAYVFRENVLLTLIGVVCGIFLGILLHRFVIVTVEVDVCMFGRIIRPVSFAISALYTIAFSAIVNGVMHFKLKKIDMVESLKSVE